MQDILGKPEIPQPIIFLIQFSCLAIWPENDYKVDIFTLHK